LNNDLFVFNVFAETVGQTVPKTYLS
jgi:hypothetical protein